MLLPGTDPAERLAVALSPVPTRKPVSAIYIPVFDLAFDMKRHVSQVKGNKQNAAPHLCLHMIRSLVHTCLTATDPYQPSDFLAVISAFPSHWCITSRGNFLHLVPCSLRCCDLFAPSLWHFPSLEYDRCGKCPRVSSSSHAVPGTSDTDLHFLPKLLQCFSKQLFVVHSRSSSNTAVGDIVPPWKPDLFSAKQLRTFQSEKYNKSVRNCWARGRRHSRTQCYPPLFFSRGLDVLDLLRKQVRVLLRCS